MSNTWASRRRGFTIVELLVVIVVIAILASVTIVSYSGIQARASRVAAQSDVSNGLNSAEIHMAYNNAYPGSITDCPTPAATNLCVPASNGGNFIYRTSTSLYLPAVEVASLNSKQFMYESRGEATGSNEFLRYTDIAPYVDRYGLVQYQIEFDIRSTDTTSKNTISLYMQNGSGTKYGGPAATIPVTTSFSHYEGVFTATSVSPSLTEAWVAFYGVYGTGNRPVVKNMKLSLM